MNNSINISDILETWAEFTNLNEEKDSWIINSWDYTFHRYNELPRHRACHTHPALTSSLR